MRRSILDTFGIGAMPWIIRVYLLLFLSTIVFLLIPGLTFFSFSAEAQSELTAIGTDALKVIIGAVIGSLSIAGQKEWGQAREDDPKPDPGAAQPADAD